MKYRLKLLPIFLFFCFYSSVNAEQVVRFTTGEWPPYLSKDAPQGGIATCIVTEAFTAAGMKTQYGWFPWKRAFKLAGREKWDGSVIWSHSPDREKDFLYSDPIVEISDVFFHLKSYAFDWSSWDDLKGIKIGATAGYYYGKAFKQAQEARQIKVFRVTTDLQNLKKLLKKRIDVFVVSQDVGFELLRKHFSIQQARLFTSHPKPVRPSMANLHLLLSKRKPDHKNLMAAFNKGLKEIKASGKFDQCFTKIRTKE